MDLRTYTAERGRAAQLARDLKAPPVLISQWASGTRPIPEDRAPAIEFATGFLVPVETACPNTRWHRVPDPAWPNGRPLIDKTPEAAGQLTPQAAAERRRGERDRRKAA